MSSGPGKDKNYNAFFKIVLPYEAQEVYGMPGFTPKDIQFAEVHDCFSIAELLHIEDLRFFKPGEGFKAVAEVQTRRYGSKPINTSGGLKCKGHPVGTTGTSQLYEVRTQLRGKAGKRQVPINDLRIGGAYNLGGTGRTSTFTIYGKEIGVMTARPFSDIDYNQYLNEEKLMGSRCRKCGEYFIGEFHLTGLVGGY